VNRSPTELVIRANALAGVKRHLRSHRDGFPSRAPIHALQQSRYCRWKSPAAPFRFRVQPGRGFGRRGRPQRRFLAGVRRSRTNAGPRRRRWGPHRRTAGTVSALKQVLPDAVGLAKRVFFFVAVPRSAMISAMSSVVGLSKRVFLAAGCPEHAANTRRARSRTSVRRDVIGRIGSSQCVCVLLSGKRRRESISLRGASGFSRISRIVPIPERAANYWKFRELMETGNATHDGHRFGDRNSSPSTPPPRSTTEKMITAEHLRRCSRRRHAQPAYSGTRRHLTLDAAAGDAAVGSGLASEPEFSTTGWAY
jgi:hypothetical protein